MLFRYWTLWMLKRHLVPLHYLVALCNDMFDCIDGIIRALANKKTQCKEDVYFSKESAQQKLSKHFPEITPMAGMLLTSAHIHDSFWKL